MLAEPFIDIDLRARKIGYDIITEIQTIVQLR